MEKAMESTKKRETKAEKAARLEREAAARAAAENLSLLPEGKSESALGAETATASEAVAARAEKYAVTIDGVFTRAERDFLDAEIASRKDEIFAKTGDLQDRLGVIASRNAQHIAARSALTQDILFCVKVLCSNYDVPSVNKIAAAMASQSERDCLVNVIERLFGGIYAAKDGDHVFDRKAAIVVWSKGNGKFELTISGKAPWEKARRKEVAETALRLTFLYLDDITSITGVKPEKKGKEFSEEALARRLASMVKDATKKGAGRDRLVDKLRDLLRETGYGDMLIPKGER